MIEFVQFSSVVPTLFKEPLPDLGVFDADKEIADESFVFAPINVIESIKKSLLIKLLDILS